MLRTVPRTILGIALLAVLAACSRLRGLDPLGPGTRLESIRVDGRARSFALHAAARDSLGAVRALVVILHGRSGNGPRMEHESGFSHLADSLGFVVAYPNGERDAGNRRSWSATDLPFLRALIDTLVRRYRLDSTRVYVAGYSSGGSLSYRAAAAMSDRIAAIGVVAGTLGRVTDNGEPVNVSTPPRPVPAIIFHGVDDQTVAYDGAASPSIRTRSLSAPRAAALWAKDDGCDSTPAVDTLPNGEAVRSQFLHCAAGSEVTFYSIVHGRHDWPDPNRVGARIPGTALMWEFFVRHPLQ